MLSQWYDWAYALRKWFPERTKPLATEECLIEPEISVADPGQFTFRMDTAPEIRLAPGETWYQPNMELTGGANYRLFTNDTNAPLMIRTGYTTMTNA